MTDMDVKEIHNKLSDNFNSKVKLNTLHQMIPLAH